MTAGGNGRDADQVRRMFDGIAGRYDLINHLLSANLDRGWRRAAAEELAHEPGRLVLDLCGGTGDQAVALLRSGRAQTVICCDFAHEMLVRAGTKFERKRLGERGLCLQADGLRLPVRAGTFEAVTVSFGVRNFADLQRGLAEIHRVLKPTGRLVVLEFSRPTGPLARRLYRLYLRRILPRLGDGVAGRSGPYGYLARTIAEFPDPPTLAGRIRDAGFAACGWKLRTGGIVAVHTAFKGTGLSR